MSKAKEAYLEAQRAADDRIRHVLELLIQFAQSKRN